VISNCALVASYLVAGGMPRILAHVSGEKPVSNSVHILARMRWLPALLLALVFTLLPGIASADGAWLDEPTPTNWNQPGMSVPQAPPPSGPIDPRMILRNRWAETAEDEAVAQAGWHLYTEYLGGWNVKVVNGTSGFDGMGRPNGYQAFVFVDGVYAGTLAPAPMDARTDGAMSSAFLTGIDSLTATFSRYTSTDALCCPSATSTVSYKINRGPDGPVVSAESTFTNPTAASAGGAL